MNVVLAEMQAMSLQFDMLLGTGDAFNSGNVEGAQWDLQEETMEEKTAPPTIPHKEENKLISLLETFPLRTVDPTSQEGIIVPPKNPPVFGSFVSLSISLGQKFPSCFEFPLVSAPMQNPSPFGTPFHNSGKPNSGAQPLHNPSQPPPNSFPNVS